MWAATSCTTTLPWLLLLLGRQRPADGHGYLSAPRSRNLLASQDTVWWRPSENDPEPETCPHCLNRGGSRARCGISAGSPGEAERNYDEPRNALGGRMPTRVQTNYTQGQDAILDVTLTAHHKGHFLFSACPISSGEIPTQACFDRHPLTFVADLLHGANYDPNYPERAYIAPMKNSDYVTDLTSMTGVMNFSFRMQLPPDLYGDLVLIQWYYLTANSCYHEGYPEYNWPSSWNIDATSSGLCTDVSSDGAGVPEQFWNCAEVRIVQGTNFVPDDHIGKAPPPWASNNSNATSPHTNVVSETLNKIGTNSSIVAIAFILVVIFLSAFTLFVFSTRNRRLESLTENERANISKNEPDEGSVQSHFSTEESWKRAINATEIYRNAMNSYRNEQIYLDEDDSLNAESVRGTSLAEPSMEMMIQDLGRGGESAHPPRAGSERWEERA